MEIRNRDGLICTDRRSCKPDCPGRKPRHFVSMGRPHPDMGGIAGQDLAMLHDLNIDRAVPSQSAFGDRPTKFPGNDMETETYPKNGEPQMQILP